MHFQRHDGQLYLWVEKPEEVLVIPISEEDAQRLRYELKPPKPHDPSDHARKVS